MTELLAVALILAGVFFFIAGSVGLLRLPDLHARLHALTKADNLGLGLVGSGVALIVGSPLLALKLFLIWIVVLAASASSAHLIAQRALRRREPE